MASLPDLPPLKSSPTVPILKRLLWGLNNTYSANEITLNNGLHNSKNP